ncbi:30S ribosomal protein S14 [Anaplasmataceae bacterium AB001_6]|nr:30S ribosomal protein S14 [Anaplasmataceae bacterium AB001_6]
MMAKKSVIARNSKRKKMAIDEKSLIAIKRKKLVEERKKIRVELAASSVDKDNSFYVRQAMLLQFKLSKLKRDSSRVRYRRRCNIDGRPRGVYRDFGISRVRIRDFAGNCLLPGIVKC